MTRKGYKALQRVVSQSVIEYHIVELVERLARQSRYGRIPDGVSPEILITYHSMRKTLFEGQEGDSVGSRLAWRVIVQMGLFMTDYLGE